MAQSLGVPDTVRDPHAHSDQRLQSAAAGIEDIPAGTGYWLLTADGHIYTFGSVPFYGSLGSFHLTERVVGLVSTSVGGYILATENGGVLALGEAGFHGSTGGVVPHSGPVIGIAPFAGADGYWMVTAEGELLAFGAAEQFEAADVLEHGSPIAAISGMPHKRGLWVAGRDGGVFCFGGAPFHGSASGLSLNAPICDIASSNDDDGYWLVAEDGGVFSFGTARFFGSLSEAPSSPVVGITPTLHCDGYWLAQSDGTVTPFGAAVDFGVFGGMHFTAPVVAIASPVVANVAPGAS